MRIQRHVDDDLPTPLREGVQALKQDDRPLSAAVQDRLAKARQAALAQHAAAHQARSGWSDVLSSASWGHPRVAGMAVFSIFFAVGLMFISNSQNDDALLLSDDMPVEAFVDNGFAAWQYSEDI
ncbi:DUF3619 family protein [Methylophilus sp. YYY-1]|uniref:DUF3619 family protein n=1 Tax=Methylophilus sp. YYY-1 TaxID=2682087 RepID=UPI0023B2F2E1|nr:DUF3619 family protein [Methylophilus sp. YYY-1]MDF0377984.1 DUF3619 family protein [Methylophilus sp. YYY-1]